MKDDNGHDIETRDFIKNLLEHRLSQSNVDARLAAVEQRLTWLLAIGTLIVAMSGLIGFVAGRLIEK